MRPEWIAYLLGTAAMLVWGTLMLVAGLVTFAARPHRRPARRRRVLLRLRPQIVAQLNGQSHSESKAMHPS